MDIFFLAEKKKRARNSNRINRTSETTLRDKERGERGKNLKEGEEIRTWSIVWKGWLRSREARQGAFSLAATKRRRFLPAIISFPFLSFLPPPPSFSYSTLLPSLLPPSVEIPRGAHSIIRYLCRTRHKSNPWQEKRPSLVHDGPRNAHPFLLLLSCHSSSPLPHSLIAVLPRLASANLATIPRFFPRVTRFRSQPDSRLNIYCPLGLINDTFLASCWS